MKKCLHYSSLGLLLVAAVGSATFGVMHSYKGTLRSTLGKIRLLCKKTMRFAPTKFM